MAQNQGVYVTGEMTTAVEESDLPGEYDVASPPAAFVTFEGDQGTAGYWKGIAYDRTQSTANSLQYSVIRHAGGARLPAATEQQVSAVQALRGARLTLRDVLIEQSAGYGLFAQVNNRIEPLNRLLVRDSQAPLYLYANSVGRVGTDVRATGNETDQIFVESPIENVSEDITWSAPDLPFRILPSQVDNTLGIGSAVTVEDGVEMRFEQDLNLVVTEDGSLTVDGTAETTTDPDTVFRGVQAQPGYWQGIRYSRTESVDNVISGAGIYHTGSAEWPYLAETEPKRAAVAVTSSGEATVENCHIAAFEGAAFAAAFTSNPLRQDSTNSTLNTSGNVVE
ncbi:hypothetical protein GJ629_05710 [Halapricum sp. CBA1109]|nr:hypothetical protein [Halapricum sp. CBA1109]